MKRKLMLLLACLFVGIGLVTAQTQKVTGVVISEEDGQPVIGASVLVKGTQIGAITGVDGDFTLPNVPSSAKTLVISYIGMQTQEVAIKPSLKVVMKSDTEMLDEVMVVAFGTAKKSAFTGSAKVVGTEKLEQSQVTNVTDALAGAVPGVTLTSNDGAPGSKSSIKIRGFSSINAKNDPLIIVDGAPYSGDINNINPNDVESMTVLKDAASNALYGARGANGVIIITTKRANMSGEAKVTFDAKWGANTRALQKYEVIDNPGMYYEMHYRAMNNYYKSTGMNDQAAWLEANKNLFGSNGGLGYNVYTVPDGQFLIGQNGKLNPNATLGRVVNYKGRDYLLTPDDWEDV
ncbi:tonB-dependent Receptor Plug domain protein, partial [Bacteroides uniformis str. 3978 T3 i]